jgi:hypothetical protein
MGMEIRNIIFLYELSRTVKAVVFRVSAKK